MALSNTELFRHDGKNAVDELRQIILFITNPDLFVQLGGMKKDIERFYWANKISSLSVPIAFASIIIGNLLSTFGSVFWLDETDKKVLYFYYCLAEFPAFVLLGIATWWFTVRVPSKTNSLSLKLADDSSWFAQTLEETRDNLYRLFQLMIAHGKTGEKAKKQYERFFLFFERYVRDLNIKKYHNLLCHGEDATMKRTLDEMQVQRDIFALELGRRKGAEIPEKISLSLNEHPVKALLDTTFMQVVADSLIEKFEENLSIEEKEKLKKRLLKPMKLNRLVNFKIYEDLEGIL